MKDMPWGKKGRDIVTLYNIIVMCMRKRNNCFFKKILSAVFLVENNLTINGLK